MGCSNIKDIIEENKLQINDRQTILEVSTFVAKGQSYEASDGNHDDLMMNLVLFGYFSNMAAFNELSDINFKKFLFNQQMKEIEADVVPFGYIDNADDIIEELKSQADMIRDEWELPYRIDNSIQHF